MADRLDLSWFNRYARAAAEWTRERLDDDHRDWLGALPLVREIGDATLVHASPAQPDEWDYLVTAEDGFAAFSALRHALVLRRALARAGRCGRSARRDPTTSAGAASVRERAGPALHRQRRQRRPAARSRSAGGLGPVGRGGRAGRAAARRLRRRRRAPEDRRGRAAAVPGRSAGGGRLSAGARQPRPRRAARGQRLDARAGVPRSPTGTGAAWIALMPLLVVVLGTHAPAWPSPGAGSYGTVFFLILLRWLNFTFRVFSAIPWPLTWGPTLLLAAYCGLYVGALQPAAWSWLARRRSTGLGAAPRRRSCGSAGEWIRGHLMGGFPWGTLGYSQYLRLPVIQIAELGGVHAVSLRARRRERGAGRRASCSAGGRRSAGVAIVAGAAGRGRWASATWRLRAAAAPGEMRVAIMQPSIEQPLKCEPAPRRDDADDLPGADAAGGRRSGPTSSCGPRPRRPRVLRRDLGLLQTLAALSRRAAGAAAGRLDRRARRRPAPSCSNTAFLVTERGIVGRYDKIHLVPFGEYVPLSGVIGFVRGWAEFIADLEPGSRAVVFPGPPAPFGVVICYEGIFPDLFREFVNNGARVMVNMTNDGWFGRTSGPVPASRDVPVPGGRAPHRGGARGQHRHLGVHRAQRADHPPPQSLRARGPQRPASRCAQGETLFTRLGDWVAWLSLAVSAALGRRRPARRSADARRAEARRRGAGPAGGRAAEASLTSPARRSVSPRSTPRWPRRRSGTTTAAPRS